jgi:hypothetical protein
MIDCFTNHKIQFHLKHPLFDGFWANVSIKKADGLVSAAP